jgi:hypothetical protein
MSGRGKSTQWVYVREEGEKSQPSKKILKPGKLPQLLTAIQNVFKLKSPVVSLAKESGEAITDIRDVLGGMQLVVTFARPEVHPAAIPSHQTAIPQCGPSMRVSTTSSAIEGQRMASSARGTDDMAVTTRTTAITPGPGLLRARFFADSHRESVLRRRMTPLGLRMKLSMNLHLRHRRLSVS